MRPKRPRSALLTPLPLLLLSLLLATVCAHPLSDLDSAVRRSRRKKRGRRPSTDNDAMPTATEEPDPACFPASAVAATVRGPVNMSALRVGDAVLAGRGRLTPVFMFSHAEPAGLFQFVELAAASGARLRLSPGHVLPTARGDLPARAVRVGDAVFSASGDPVRVARVRNVVDVGLYNPQTAAGTIVVDGVLVSTYTEHVPHAAAAAALAPLRAAFAVCGKDFTGGAVAVPGVVRNVLLAVREVLK